MHESTAALFVLFIAASLEFMYPLIVDAAAAFAHRVLTTYALRVQVASHNSACAPPMCTPSTPPYYILLEGYRARPPGPEPQLEDSYTGRLLTSRRDTIAYGTIPCIYLRKEDLDGPSSLVQMCVKID